MSTITVPRPDVTTDQVRDALTKGLGAKYNVVPDSDLSLDSIGGPRSGESDSIVVGTGSNRIFRAEVKIARQGGQTVLHVHPGGLSAPLRLTNQFWIARRVRHVLQASPGLH
jgi:hypothetical protein